MNKFIEIVTIFACLGAIVAAAPLDELEGSEAASSWALDPTDNEETANLDDVQRIYADYCIRSRNDVKADLNALIEAAKKLYDPFLPSYEQKKNQEEAKNLVEVACERALKVESKLKADFEEFKGKLAGEIAGTAATEVTFESVKCVTSQRVLNAANYCRE